uniref:Global nitrogen transcriptional regulator n=1 Tax=Porolithon onkodes TaxID=231751 RepID=A0A2Z2KSE1_9FLOR|nr:global nitrogen transcriptional regulator [Porolithon onkodes]ASB29669.1 global nitrogen transcriptional regulator [Porolithon onkodes]
MKWLQYLETYNISFNIKILNTEDSIIINKNNYAVYIIDGFMQKLQVFTNKETLCTQLLYSNHILEIFKLTQNKLCLNRNYSYKFVALKKTIILIVHKKEFINKSNKYNQLIYSLAYFKLIYNGDILAIISHKNTRKRLIQFLFIIIERLGIFKKNRFLIPFNLPHSTIATIIGSQRITVNKIMNKLKKERILFYSNQKISIINIIKLIY